MLAVYLVTFSLGFFGSMHCIGMCGGLVSALSMSRPRIWWSGLAAYQAGRVLTYSFMGLAVGLLGASLQQSGSFGQIQVVLTILAGLMMITFGLNFAGWMPDPFVRLAARVNAGLGFAGRINKAAASSAQISWFGVGLANGLLPCGLVYVALSLSLASGGTWQPALMMMAFGLGTVPAMMFAPVVVRYLTPENRGLVMKALGILIILFGLVTMIRGTSWMHAMHTGGTAETHTGQHQMHQHPMHNH
jgi:sulfite exporter TauE/SafE